MLSLQRKHLRMMHHMNSKQFVDKVSDVANKYNTLYVMGCYGA